MEDENVIRDEALDFYRNKIKHSQKSSAIEDFHEIKDRLHDFYSPEGKSIFLDEVKKHISADLELHRLTAHGGKPGIDCRHEIKPDKLLFYIKQEIGTLPIVAHQKNKSNPEQVRDKVFVCYSHYDIDFLIDIQRHLKPLGSRVALWEDSRIRPGQKWKEEIAGAIALTKIAVLLLSTDFLGSEFITTDELPPLLQAAENDGAVILPVIIKPCLLDEFPTLIQYQSLNPPSRPVIKMEYTEKEELYVNLARQILRILKDEA